MKKHKLVKSLLFAPLATIPLVAASCDGLKPPTNSSALLYLNIFNQVLYPALKLDVQNLASSPTFTISQNTLIEQAKANGKGYENVIDNYDPANFNRIGIVFHSLTGLMSVAIKSDPDHTGLRLYEFTAHPGTFLNASADIGLYATLSYPGKDGKPVTLDTNRFGAKRNQIGELTQKDESSAFAQINRPANATPQQMISSFSYLSKANIADPTKTIYGVGGLTKGDNKTTKPVLYSVPITSNQGVFTPQPDSSNNVTFDNLYDPLDNFRGFHLVSVAAGNISNQYAFAVNSAGDLASQDLIGYASYAQNGTLNKTANYITSYQLRGGMPGAAPRIYGVGSVGSDLVTVGITQGEKPQKLFVSKSSNFASASPTYAASTSAFPNSGATVINQVTNGNYSNDIPGMEGKSKDLFVATDKGLNVINDTNVAASGLKSIPSLANKNVINVSASMYQPFDKTAAPRQAVAAVVENPSGDKDKYSVYFCSNFNAADPIKSAFTELSTSNIENNTEFQKSSNAATIKTTISHNGSLILTSDKGL